MKNLHRFDLLLVSIGTMVCAAVVLLDIQVPVVRITVAVLLILVLPGYAFFAALFPRRSPASAESFLIMTGSSIMITIFSGLLLYGMGQKIETMTWTLVLSGFVLAGCLIGAIRRLRGAYSVAMTAIPSLKWRNIGLLIIAVGLMAGALGIVSSPITNPDHLQGYAILWILPAQNSVPASIRVGVVNDQFEPTRYRLQVSINGKTVKTWPDVQLDPGMSWETSFEIPASLSPADSVQASLFKSDNPNIVYRQVKLVTGQ